MTWHDITHQHIETGRERNVDEALISESQLSKTAC